MAPNGRWSYSGHTRLPVTQNGGRRQDSVMRSASGHGGSAASASSHGFAVTVYSDDLECGHVFPAPKGWVTSLSARHALLKND